MNLISSSHSTSAIGFLDLALPLLPRRPFPAPELRPTVPPFLGVASAPFFSGGQQWNRIAGRYLGGNTARQRAPPAPEHGAPQLHGAGAELGRDHLDSDGVDRETQPSSQ